MRIILDGDMGSLRHSSIEGLGHWGRAGRADRPGRAGRAGTHGDSGRRLFVVCFRVLLWLASVLGRAKCGAWH